MESVDEFVVVVLFFYLCFVLRYFLFYTCFIQKGLLFSSVWRNWMSPGTVFRHNGSEYNGRLCSMVPFTSFQVSASVWT